MPSTSKSNRRRKAKKSKFVPKPKQRWQVKQPTRNWLELPSDIMANILYRVGVYDILENAQKVCTAWRKICKDPAMWRVISMDNHGDPCTRPPLREMCKNAVDRSQGQLLDLTIIDFVDYELLEYVAESLAIGNFVEADRPIAGKAMEKSDKLSSDRSSQLKRLEIIYCFGEICGAWGDVLKKFPLLEELSLYTTEISEEDIEAAGRYCPLLKTLRVNQNAYRFHIEDDESITWQNEMAISIGKNLPALRHLELIGNCMTNIGLKAILDGCCHLESLDLRRCLYIDLKGDMGKECVKQIKIVRLPDESLEDCPHIHENMDEPCDVSSDSGTSVSWSERLKQHMSLLLNLDAKTLLQFSHSSYLLKLIVF
ncbi:F-box domain, Leucine-rich repeat domain, L domain-like protein [Artemisia annua]|uniref:F-box domain, Leucine-rich repeat domain, L domain-like protein n=1 Tax=Artemisia annua TaxID=35608 RepID=A0A2U1NYI2_ARTAN|nr:F-box domain, Leucine-rich repeat domain, L domain-like protein [Artemisia annua]